MYYISTSADCFSYYLQGYDCLLNVESLEKKLIHVEEQERFVFTSTCNTIEVACTLFIYFTFFHVACFGTQNSSLKSHESACNETNSEK